MFTKTLGCSRLNHGPSGIEAKVLAHYVNGNILKVKTIIRHKRVDNTMKHIQMLNLENEEFEVTIATTSEEINNYAWMAGSSMTK